MTLFTSLEKWTVAALALSALVFTASAGSLSVEGVLANSGEQGKTLARFGDGKGERGIGVVYDDNGSLWAGGRSGEVIRYTVDGRQLAAYKTPDFGAPHEIDRVMRCGDALLLKLNKKLYVLPFDAAPGSAAKPLNVEASKLSFGTHDGWAAAALESRVFWVNAKGETRDIGNAPGPVRDLDVGPDGEVYLRTDDMMRTRTVIKLSQPEPPYSAPGFRIQWLNGSWFGHDWHGTIRRFNRSLEPDPGVVLGGNSGSFLGYVPGNYELSNCTGMAWLGGNQYAAAGISGVLHLIVWDPQAKRFEISRRIGPLKNCLAVALDGKGRIWFLGGVLQWHDSPDAPLQHGVPGAGAESGAGPFAAAVLPGDAFVAAGANERGGGTFYSGMMDGPADRPGSDLIQKDFVAGALIHWNKRTAFAMVNAEGKGVAMYVSSTNGRLQNQAGEIVLQGTTPIQKLTSLTSDGINRLWAAADGQIIEFVQDADQWKERKRWKQWNTPAAGTLGEEAHLSFSQDRLWVADTTNHRVLVFDAESRALLAQVGTAGKPGNDLSSFNAPRALSANGDRAVVFDSENQRLVKLLWHQ